MNYELRTNAIDFYTYPPVGADDWRYVYQSARVRVLEMQMLTRAAFQDMVNAENLRSALDLLSSTEYSMPHSGKNFAEIDNCLSQRRSAVHRLFEELIIDKPVVHLFRTRTDFANLRLAVRRTLTEKPIGTDYSADGNVPPEQFEQVFSEENPAEFPDYMADAVEQAVLAYYRNKQVPDIDHAIDAAQAQYNLIQAHRLKSIFLLGLFKIQIDLTNIRTMLRLKFTESEQRNVFLEGGFIELERLQRGVELGYEAVAPLFYVTPYYRLIEVGAAYLNSNKSFLKLEQQSWEHLTGFLKSTVQITTGPQPIIAFLLLKENEIRTVRLILTAKKNNLDTKLILDRIS
jgi:V/A-type H+-transporting ATPase subunit C